MPARAAGAGRLGSGPLQRDVRLLTTLLGQAIAESGGDELLAVVEGLREATKSLRSRPSPKKRRAVQDLVASLDQSRAEDVIRAFTTYFQLVNVAEEQHRVRNLRAAGSDGLPTRGSIAEAVGWLEGLGLDATAALADLEITPVLTAHPTEAKRRAVVEHLWRIAALLEQVDDPRAPAQDSAQTTRRLAEEIAGLWLTDQVRIHRPEPLDEVRALMALFDQTIFSAAPLTYREVDRALDPQRCGSRQPAFGSFLRWSSWVGADRDGNPAVTAAVTLAAAEIQTDHILRGLERVTQRIARALSVSEREVPASGQLRDSLSRDALDLGDRSRDLERKLPDAPHRRKLALVADRLSITRARGPGGGGGAYDGVSSFLDDLRILQSSLADGGAPRLAYGGLQDLIWQAETFGFHLASLEIRQHASVLAEVLAEVAPQAAGDLERIDALSESGAPVPPELSANTREVLATFETMGALQARLGVAACHRFIVSFTRSPSDLATVHALAHIAVPHDTPQVTVVPLLESRRELASGPQILQGWLDLARQRSRIQAAGNRLEVMLGYSDSAKEVGVMAANLELYAAQRGLAAWAADRGIDLTIFHGRGGALGRGGGPASRAILSQPPGSIQGRFKATEQGEVAFARYGNQAVARHHLDQLTSSVLRASAAGRQRRDNPDPADLFVEEIDTMVQASAGRYQELVGDPGIVQFLQLVTPIEQIGNLPIASRPVSRGRPQDLESLRAIPWVFAWAQARVNLAGWFGLGSGLRAVARSSSGVQGLRRMFSGWPFFTAFVENAELSLAKADPQIAELYLDRGRRPELSRAILDELKLSTELVLEVTGHGELLDCRPSLQRAIRLRDPYVDALSFLQLRFLGDPWNPSSERLIQATINGVAAGLQNTG